MKSRPIGVSGNRPALHLSGAHPPGGLQMQRRERLKRPSGGLSLQGVGDLDPNRCRHATVGIVHPVQCLARDKPGPQPNRCSVLLYTTRHGDTMARQQEGHCVAQHGVNSDGAACQNQSVQ